MTLYEKLQNGTYENKLTYPRRSKVPGSDPLKYAAELDVYLAESRKINQQFKSDLFDKYGVMGDPKFDKAYHLAYELGHASGYGEIARYFDELVELIK